MGLPSQAINSILNLSNEERYKYAIKRIADSRVLYVLADDDENWSLWSDDQGHTSLAIWPEMEFAKISLEEDGDVELSIFELELEMFLEEGIPWLMENNFGIALFPTPNNSTITDIGAIQFASVINQILDESYGEALDLPYL
ncbi:Protein of uncharacterised function (DUF2750) [Kingella potus]|uniref:Protein of uncharacterized function (DUF2750) n=2 Tax=Kingella potus TaxID=265175 RepID=A0A377R5W3_9NEIS|nr:DUF2750 domain-containing protein [Kingella potus]STR03372.1 Protein of uncharacterised function (DUF2750) [Kingella potus]